MQRRGCFGRFGRRLPGLVEQSQHVRIEPTRAWPRLEMASHIGRIDGGDRLDQAGTHSFARICLATGRRHPPDEPVQADAVRGERRIALVGDRFAVDQGEGAQRRHGFVEPIFGEHRGQWLAEPFTGLGEQEQRDRFRRESCRVGDQRFDRRVEPRGLLDGERERPGHRQAIVIFGRRVPGIVEQPRRRRMEPPGVVGQRHLEPLAIGGGLFMRQRQAAKRLRQCLAAALRSSSRLVRAIR